MLLATPANSETDIADVAEYQGSHQNKGDSQPILLANEFAKALSRGNTHTPRDFLSEGETDPYWNDSPEQRVAKLAPAAA